MRIIRSLFTRATRWPPVGATRFGDLRRLEPISATWGFDRGKPIDRYYIENFLANHANDVRGRVLEIGANHYTRRFGGQRVTGSDVLDIVPSNPKATIVADLAHGDEIPSNAFDCIIFTQTLQYIYDLGAAVRNLRRILGQRGVVLATFPGIAKISRYDMERTGDSWRLTSFSARRLFGEVFLTENVEVSAYGNVLSAIAFLHGLAAGELTHQELDYQDRDYEVVVSVRAVKPS